jgi:hypothetical protein
MATVDEWQAALTTPAWIAVDSSAGLIEKVRVRLSKRKSKTPEPKALSPAGLFSDADVRVTPSNLLHSIGKVTTPAIPNLTALCTTWAEVRYIWAFDPNRAGMKPRLRLSEEADVIDFHQKALLSDEVGVGIAALLVERYGRTDKHAHVSEAGQASKFGLYLRTRLSPDYVFFGDKTPLFVVECKGTRSSLSNAIGQLARGCIQLASVSFRPKPKRKVVRLVLCTHMKPSGGRVYAVDPPEEDDVEQETPSTTIDPNTLDSFNRAGKLAFVGDYAASIRHLPRDLSEHYAAHVDPQPRLDTLEIAHGRFRGATFVGSTERRSSPDGIVLELFRGMERQRYEAAREGTDLIPRFQIENTYQTSHERRSRK